MTAAPLVDQSRFLADYDFNAEILDGLVRREPSIDFLSGFEAGLEGIPDPGVLEKAADEGRVLVTHDRRAMPYYFAEFIPRRQSPGVLIVSQRIEIGVAIDDLLLIWSASDSDEWINRILYIHGVVPDDYEF